MNIELGFYNLWFLFVLGYGIILASMAWANQKRGKPIEDPEVYELHGKKRMFVCAYLPFISFLIGSIFVSINIGTLFWIGSPVFISGIMLNIIAMYSFSQFTGGLNTMGIYRYSRNPMSAGIFLFVLGLNLMGWSISLMNIIFVILSVLWIGATHLAVLQEESFLENKYGNSFREYMKKIPRYVGMPKEELWTQSAHRPDGPRHRAEEINLKGGTKMDDQSVDYGNWVPKKMLILLLMLTSLFGAFSFLPAHIIVRVVFGILSAVFLLFLLYFYYSYHVFGANGGEFQKKILNVVLDKLPWDGQGKALDIGTGAGALTIGVAKKYPGAKVTGIDYWGKGWSYSQKMCEKNAAIEGVGEQTNFQRASAADLPFDDDKFDAAVSNFVFHEVKDARDKRDVIREALRVVRKGGAFSFQDLFLVHKLYGDIDDLIETIHQWGIEEVHFTSTADLVDIPRLLRTPFMLGEIGIIYGKK